MAWIGVSIGMNVLGAGIAAYGAHEAGESQQDYYNYLAAENEKTAALMNQTATENVGIVTDQEGRDLTTNKQMTSAASATQKTALAANGVWGGTTAEDLAKDTFNKGKMDELAIRYNADMSRYSIRKEAEENVRQLLSQAEGYRKGGANAASAGNWNAASSLLSGGGAVADSWYKNNK